MYFIALNTQGPDTAYANLRNAIEALGPWSNRMAGCWIVESKLSARRIRDLLKPHLQAGDKLMVGQFSRNWAATNMGAGFPEWMGRRTFDTAAAADADKK